MSVVVISGCIDNKTSDNEAANSTAPPTGDGSSNNSVNVPPNSTMSPGGNPGNMPSNSSKPPRGNPGNMPSNSTMPPAGENQS